MANNDNLIPQAHTLTVDEASKGGIRSGEVRRERKQLKDTLLYLLSIDIKPDETVQEGICQALLNQALKGNLRAFETIRDTIGEKPVENVTLTQKGPPDFSALDAAFAAMDED